MVGCGILAPSAFNLFISLKKLSDSGSVHKSQNSVLKAYVS